MARKMFFAAAAILLCAAAAAAENAVITVDFDGALKQALEKNVNVTKAVSDIRIAKATVEKTYGMFDLMLKGGVTYMDQKSAPTSALSTDQVQVLSYTAGLSNKIFTGGILSLDFSSGRTAVFYPDQSGNTGSMFSIDPSLFSSGYNPAYAPKLTLTFMQPLLKDFWGRPDEKAIKIGELAITMAKDSLRAAVLDQVSQLKEAYYFVYMAGQLYEIQKDFYTDAEKLYNETLELRRMGMREERDVLQAKASMLGSKAELKPAQDSMIFAKENFLNAAGFEPAEWNSCHVALTTSVEDVKIPDELSQELEDALVEMQPAVKISKSAFEAAATGKEIADNSALPSLNLVGSYGIEGIGADLAASYDNMGETRYKNFMIGANFSYSFPNRSASGDIKDKDEGRKKAAEQYASMKKMMKIQVRSVYRSVITSRLNYELRSEAAGLQKKRLKSDQVNFSQGRISTRELVFTQMDYLTSRIKEANAMLEYAKAAAAWNRISGKYDVYCNETVKGD